MKCYSATSVTRRDSAVTTLSLPEVILPITVRDVEVVLLISLVTITRRRRKSALAMILPPRASVIRHHPALVNLLRLPLMN